MNILIYSLSFIPILLITLTVHELGHLFFARWAGLKTSGFQIGAAWKIITFHTGRTQVRLTPQTITLNQQAPSPERGHTVFVYVSPNPDGGLLAAAVLNYNRKWPITPEEQQQVRQLNQDRMRIAGRVREAREDRLVIADMEWSLRAIPLMAGVHLPEDPSRTIPEAYNNTRWRNKAAITLAGPMANIWLMVMTILILAIFPITSVQGNIFIVTHVEQGSPAARAGLQPGDHILRVQDSLRITPERIRNELREAREKERPMDLEVSRGGEILRTRVMPQEERDTMGIMMQPAPPSTRSHSLHPNSIASRFTNISQIYFRSLHGMAASIGSSEQQQGPVITGPIMGAYETAQAIDYVGPKAWIITLATINLGVAILNLIPFPPLDGFRMTMETVQAIRHGEPLNPRVEQALVLGGMSLIWMAGIYLILNDLIRLLL